MAKAIEPELMRRLINMADWMQGLGSEGQPMHVVLHTDEPIDINDATPEVLPQGGHSLPVFFGSSETVTGAYVHDSSEKADPGLDLPITTLRATPPQGRVTAPMTFDRDPGMDLPSGGFVPPERYPTNILAFTTPEAAGDFIGQQAQREAEAAMTNAPRGWGKTTAAAEQSLRDAEATADDRLEAAIEAREVTRRTAITRAGYAIRDAGRITDSEAAWLMRWITDGNRPRETQ